MKVLIEIQKGLFVQRDHIAAVKSSAEGDSCQVFTTGQPNGQGFFVNQRFEDVMDALHSPESDVMEAASVLIEVLDRAAPYMNEISEVAAAAEHPYEGPNFLSEIEDLRIALAQAK